MKLLFIADPLEGFKPYKDSTFAIMREAQQRGDVIYHALASSLHWESGNPVCALAHTIQLNDSLKTDWFTPQGGTKTLPLRDFNAVLMRTDPPFNAEYVHATHLLSQAEKEGARVFNSPQALREYPEKLSLMRFAYWTPPTLVSSDASKIRAFFQQHQDIILKPLDGMGGAGIFRVQKNGLNLGSIIESLTQNGTQAIMVQRYLPEIEAGDKRILIIAGQAVPYALARIPQAGEVRGNLAAGGRGAAQPLSASDWAIARDLGPRLARAGLLLAGLDVIGTHLTEVNVTSPTCFQEITTQTGFDVAATFYTALQDALKAKASAGQP